MKSILFLILTVTFSLQSAYSADTDEVKAWLYSSPQGQDCDQREDSWPAEQAAEKYEITYQTPWSDGETTYTFYSVLCYAGAYNLSSIFVQKDEYAAGGYSVISFSDIYVNYVMTSEVSDEMGEVDVLQSWEVEGFYATNLLTNADYDSKSETITTFAKGRGVGDAFSSNTYTFKNGQWLLTRAVADPTFDGEITPITVFEVNN